MSNFTNGAFRNPSLNRFSYSALPSLESTSNYLNELCVRLHVCQPSKSNSKPGLPCTTTISTAAMNDKPSIFVHTPIDNDTGALARIHLAAFKDDRCVRLMYSDANHWRAINTMIENRCSHTNYGMKIAMTEPGKRMVGWLSCCLVEPTGSVSDDSACLEWTTAAAGVIDCAEECLTRSSGTPEDRVVRDRRREMCRVISKAYIEALSSSPNITTDTKYIVINTLVVDPSFRNQGVGSGLLGWVMQYADTEDIAVWAQVPAAACGVFKKAGFEESQNLVLDLDGFYHNQETKGKPVWGFYEFKYMVKPQRRIKT